MRPNQDDYDVIQSMLIAELGAEPEAFEPGVKGPEKKRKKWVPLHGPTQTKIFNDRSPVVGACAEKYTGKTAVMSDCVIAHCYEEWDALAVVIGNAHRALAEGFCNDMMTFSLPRWRDGNRGPMFIRDERGQLIPNPQAGQLIDEGIGLEYSGWKTDPNNKDLYLKIRNRFGGWSRIRVIAIPYAAMVQSRVTNLNASMFYLEEATRTDGDDYYTWPSLQLFRRHGIKVQQFLFSCNPDDPKHWVYGLMYKTCVVGNNEEGRVWADDPEKPGIRRDKDTAFYYLRYHENEVNVSAQNRANLKKTLRAKPIMRDRLIHCKWIAMPAGDALFVGEFDELKHCRGDVEKKRGLVPVPGHPIVLGLDWGSRSIGLVFTQVIESDEGPFCLVFDEICYYQELHKSRRLAVAILAKMRFWTMWLQREREDESARWGWWFIAGDDITTNVNPETGSINARDIEDHMRTVIEEDPLLFGNLEPPHIRGCPRPKDSVEKRVDILAEHMMENRVMISELCQGVKGMCLNVPSDPERPGRPAGKNRWIHILDALTYVLYYRRFYLREGFTNIEDGVAVSVR